MAARLHCCGMDLGLPSVLYPSCVPSSAIIMLGVCVEGAAKNHPTCSWLAYLSYRGPFFKAFGGGKWPILFPNCAAYDCVQIPSDNGRRCLGKRGADTKDHAGNDGDQLLRPPRRVDSRCCKVCPLAEPEFILSPESVGTRKSIGSESIICMMQTWQAMVHQSTRM